MTRQRIAFGLTCLFSASLILSAIMKLVGSSEVMEGFAKMGLADWRIIIALGELSATALFFLPQTKNFVTMVLSGYLGGPIMAHMSHGEDFSAPAIFLVLIWFTAGLRQPDLYGFKTGS